MKRYLLFGLFGLAASLTTSNLTYAAPPRRVVPLDGTWKFEYSCGAATGMYAGRCSAGERDSFSLSIVQRGHRFCGSYEATAQMNNHVDDGYLNDWKFARTADRAFRVHFHLSGTVGEAAVQVDGDKLHWKTLTEQAHREGQPLTWSFSPPKTATLVRQARGDPLTCTR